MVWIVVQAKPTRAFHTTSDMFYFVKPFSPEIWTLFLIASIVMSLFNYKVWICDFLKFLKIKFSETSISPFEYPNCLIGWTLYVPIAQYVNFNWILKNSIQIIGRFERSNRTPSSSYDRSGVTAKASIMDVSFAHRQIIPKLQKCAEASSKWFC